MKINPTLSNKFRIRNLSVEAELLGSSHEFDFEECKVKIILPSSDKIPQNHWDRDKELSLVGYRKENDIIIPLKVEVRFVTVEVEIVERIIIPDNALEEGLKSRKVYTEIQINTLSKISDKYIGIAERAFDLWVRTLRWKCWDGEIGRPEISGSETGDGIFLYEKETKKSFWLYHPTITLNVNKEIDITDWEETKRALVNSIKPPVFIDLFFDAVEHLTMKDFQRAMIDAAVACETLMRIEVIQSLPDTLSQAIEKFIDEANVRQVVTKFFPDLLPIEKRQRFKKIESNLHKLFDARNRILHSGYLDKLSEEDCRKYINAASELISLMDENILEQSGKENSSRVSEIIVITEG